MLSDPQKRKQYDTSWHQHSHQAHRNGANSGADNGFASIFDAFSIFAQVFSGGFGATFARKVTMDDLMRLKAKNDLNALLNIASDYLQDNMVRTEAGNFVVAALADYGNLLVVLARASIPPVVSQSAEKKLIKIIGKISDADTLSNIINTPLLASKVEQAANARLVSVLRDYGSPTKYDMKSLVALSENSFSSPEVQKAAFSRYLQQMAGEDGAERKISAIMDKHARNSHQHEEASKLLGIVRQTNATLQKIGGTTRFNADMLAELFSYLNPETCKSIPHSLASKIAEAASAKIIEFSDGINDSGKVFFLSAIVTGEAFAHYNLPIDERLQISAFLKLMGLIKNDPSALRKLSGKLDEVNDRGEIFRLNIQGFLKENESTAVVDKRASFPHARPDATSSAVPPRAANPSPIRRA